ncbi:serine/threonine protein kinase [Microbispora bryophytorum]|nr:serine/threonine protein kinase [Microbispora bryophytorum]
MEDELQGSQQLRADDPRQVGAYRIVGLLGEGGQGVVYRGVGVNAELVAVKLLHARFSGDAKARARFAAELAHAGKVAAFCTARVLDADVEGDRPYIVSEFVDGPALSQVIAAGRAPQGPALERLAIATVTALAAIHEAGIVHRDFKPSNVIMGADGPRVIDFGIARALDATGTLSSAIVGTPAFMAPEQVEGGEVGPAADVFAWACTIAYAANGVTPFGQDSIPAVMHRILTGEPDLGRLVGALHGIVTECLAKDPAGRPSARAILLRLLGGTQSSSTPETLLIAGARASASGTLLSAEPTRPVGEPPTRQVARPAAPGGERAGAGRRATAYAVAAAALFLGAATFLPWGRVGKLLGSITLPIDNADVAGLATQWGAITLVMAVAAMAVAVTDALTRRLSAAWAVVPGGVAAASMAVFWIRQDDLHSKHPSAGMLTADDLRELGTSFHVSISYGWYTAIALAAVLVVLSLVSLLVRRS